MSGHLPSLPDLILRTDNLGLELRALVGENRRLRVQSHDLVQRILESHETIEPAPIEAGAGTATIGTGPPPPLIDGSVPGIRE